MMDIRSLGDVTVANDVIAKIAGHAALEIEGVAGLKETITGGLAKLLGKDDSGSGVKVSIQNDQVMINVNLSVYYGVPIPEVSFRVQQNIKQAVEKMTGKQVMEVNVNICDVIVRKETPQPASYPSSHQ